VAAGDRRVVFLRAESQFLVRKQAEAGGCLANRHDYHKLFSFQWITRWDASKLFLKYCDCSRLRNGLRLLYCFCGVLHLSGEFRPRTFFVHNLCDRYHGGRIHYENQAGKPFMAQIFDRSSNALARASLVLTGLIVIALGVTLDQLQRSPWVTRQGQRPDQPVPFSHKHHVQGLGLQCQYCHVTVEKSSYAGIPPTKTCMNCHAQIWTNAQLLEPVRSS
jgi:hypothetical protein